MNAPATPKLGNVIDVDPAWVAKVTEEALEPALLIVDPHHHLNSALATTTCSTTRWPTPDWPQHRRHVFVDCHSIPRGDGPAEQRCVGETELANAWLRCAPAALRQPRACAAIVSHVCAWAPGPARCSMPRSGPATPLVGIRYQTGLTRTWASGRPAPTRRPAHGRQDLARGFSRAQARAHLRQLDLPSAARRGR